MIMSEKPTIFISYSRDDHKAKDFVVSHLKLLEQHSELRFWHDQDMAGGDAWEEEIDRRLNDCVAALILISKNSLTSQFILRTELKVMLERRHRDGLRIYPIVIENCLWKTYPWLVAMNVRPDRGDPLMRQASGKRDDIMVAIGEEIADLLLNNGDMDDDEDENRVPGTDSSNGASIQTSRSDHAIAEPAMSLQDWGKSIIPDKSEPVPADSPSATPTRGPAPSPPALISIPGAPVWSEDLGIPVPDSFLLKPESRVVPFFASDMDWREAIFGWAKDRERPVKLRLQAGAGGTGKTRLALDVCETLIKEDWFAGFLPADFDGDDVERDLPALLDAGRDCLFVIDYAETRADVVVTLARQLLIAVERNVKAAAPRRRFRIVMLAREGGDWFHQLAERATRASDEALKALLTAGSTKSGPHRMSFRPMAPSERRQIFEDALQAFATRTGLPAKHVNPPDLAIERFDRVLMIQMAALAALRNDAIGDGRDLLDNTLGHERRYWRKLLGLGEDADDGRLRTFEQSLALITLLGGRDSDAAAKAVIARVPRLRNQGAEAELSMFDRLRRFYPNRGSDGDAVTDGIRGLEPDLLGERLVADCLEWDKELLDAALDPKRKANADDARAAFTVLARLAIQRDDDKTHLERALTRYFATWTRDILAVAKETGGPIGDLIAAATKEAEPKVRRSILKQAKGDVPKDTINLKKFGIEIDERTAEAIRTGRGARKMGCGDLNKLYTALRVLVHRHVNNDEQREAAEVSEQALKVAERLAKTGKPDDLLRLVLARNDFSNKLMKVGRFSEALTHSSQAEGLALTLRQALSGQTRWMQAYTASISAYAKALKEDGQFEAALGKSREALRLQQRLVTADNEHSRSNEAGLSVNLSGAYLTVGEYEAGLEVANEAEAISRELVAKDPESHRALRAMSLKSRSNSLSVLGEFKDALQAVELAVELYKQLADQQPDLYASNLCGALASLSLRCRDLSLFDDALDAARHAEFIERDLAARQPEAYQFYWMIALANLGEAMINTGDFAEAIEVTEKAIGLLPTLELRPGDDNQRIAPGFCRRVLAEARLGAGEPEAALEVAEAGASNLREAFAARPDHVAEHYVQGLVTLAKCHRALGDDPGATQVLAEGMAGVAPLFKKRPRALQREMLRLIEPLEAIGPAAAALYVTEDVRAELTKLPELPRGAAGL